ncbi:hypothetical protein [Actinomycetospora sp. CA-084318]|uniref:tetratricopeptide repeat protein n=1 Tax=Actinomycetospora sp. CA-084318 TaxID=3239892 RepID=UPI003D975E6B
MAARNEHGAPSALTVLEVAEGLRWTAPALGASLAEHVRRVAGDDPAVRAAADRSVLRSLVESDRHEEVVERGVPLLAEARDRGDRDDGAAVLVDLAVAATELGDPGLARRLLDRLGPLDELPARVGAAACAARAEACAAEGDVAATDAAADDATPVLFRVPQPEAAVLRARVALARGIARRRAGDVDGALATLAAAVSADPAGDADGGRRSMAAAAEETELLVETGRHDEARERARRVLPDGSPGPHVAHAVGRIRLASLAASGGGVQQATSIAEELEAAGRTAGAARAWELVAGLAEADGDLGRALAALRRGHGLASTARDANGRALRALAGVADGADLLAVGGPTADNGSDAVPTRGNGVRGGRRRRPDPTDAQPFPTTSPAPSGIAPAAEEGRAVRNGTTAVVGTSVDDTWARTGTSPRSAGTPVPDAVGPVGPDHGHPVDGSAGNGTTGATDGEPSRSTRDELAELLASLTRSMDSTRASASAMGLEPAPALGAEPVGDTGTPVPEPDPVQHSRHSALALPPPGALGSTVSEPSASRPTFDAFSTAPRNQPGAADGHESTVPVAPLPDDRFAPAEVGATADRAWTRTADSAAPASVSSLLDPFADPLGDTSRESPERSSGTARTEDAAAPRATTNGVEQDLPLLSGWVGFDGSASPDAARGDESRKEPTEPGRDGAGDSGVAAPEAVRDGLPEERSAEPSRSPFASGADSGSGSEPARAVPSGSDDPSGPHDSSGRRTGDADESRETGAAIPRGRVDRAAEIGERTSAGTSSGSARSTGRRRDETPTRDAGRGTPSRSPSPSPEPRDRRDAPQSPSSSVGSTPTRPTDEYEEDLALTLATVLGEYHLPDVPMPPRRDGVRPAQSPRPPDGAAPVGDVAVPSARRHTSGSMPVPADQRWAPRPEGSTGRPGGGAPDDARRDGAGAGAGANGRGRPPESGAKLADLLAEAMDAFRHVGPEPQEGSRGPGVGSRRA